MGLNGFRCSLAALLKKARNAPARCRATTLAAVIAENWFDDDSDKRGEVLLEAARQQIPYLRG